MADMPVPDDDLDPDQDPTADVQSGLFGKMTATGDFVGRGLPDGFRRAWDHWLTQFVAPRLQQDMAGPAGGLRFRLVSGGRVAAGVILPSQDSVGRRFPLSLLLLAADLPGPAGLDIWCDAAVALDHSQLPDDLWADLDALPVPQGDGGRDALLLWAQAVPVQSADPVSPEAALDALWSAGLAAAAECQTPDDA